MLITLISRHQLIRSCIGLNYCVLKTQFWIFLEITDHLTIVVHSMYCHCLWVKTHTRFNSFSITLMKIIKPLSKTYSTLVLHQCVKPCGLSSLATLLTRIEYLSSTILIINASLHLLMMVYRLCLVVSKRRDLFVLTIWGAVVRLSHCLWYPSLII